MSAPMIDDLKQLAHDAPAATWPFTAIATILFFMRTFSRVRLQKDSFGWDDAVITVSWAISISGAAFFQISVNRTHQVIADPTTPSKVSPAAFWALFTAAWGYVTVALPKLVVGILICRLFRPKPWLRTTIMTYCVIFNIISLLALIFSFTQCSPVAGQWDPFNHPDVHCWNKNVQLTVTSISCVLSAITDIAFTLYPAFIIWKLKMPTWTKVGAISLMSLGLASFALAIVKLYAIFMLANSSQNGGGVYGTLYWCIDMILWSRLESDFVISAACLPAAPPCFRVVKRMVTGAGTEPAYPTYKNFSRSYKSSPRSRTHKDPDALELNPKDEHPGDDWGIKVGTEITTTYNYL
ncbi:hypothetical protein N7492_000207 [Penicillium capsulatum]|uniref:Rhodopsin domain-containing protein n=1 Tax=Penicillium capsulatum TaxID=69766 RepID=A0A9W9LYC0_9EURO|nr:hypothetical protein N7492_000207 [Penicillium capsulatum]KAJ6130728.1 hypothetical protein N7512_003508 [Penicillium capsulatum]